MSAGAITAESIGASARFDPQLRIPLRPRRRRGLVTAPGESGLLVEGGPKRQWFGGRAATDLLPRVLDQLDGRRDHAELAAALGVPEPTLFKVLSLLWTSGVIEEGPSAPAPAGTADRLADFLSRIGDSTGAHAGWEDSARQLAAARIAVLGDPELAAAVLAAIEPPLTAQLLGTDRPAPGTTLVVLAGTTADDRIAATARYCWDNAIPVLRLALRGRVAQLGPLVDPRTTPCLSCLTDDPGDPDDPDDRPTGPVDVALAAALFTGDLFALVSRSTPTPLPTRWRRIDLETLAAADACGATRPGCPLCSVAAGPVGPAPRSVVFERFVGMPPKAYADLKAHQMHYRPANLALQRKHRSWPSAPRQVLPGPRFERLSGSWTGPAAEPGPVTADDVSVLLAVTAGLQGTTPVKVQRWTASGGNIGSVTAFAAIRDCAGLDPGVYAYVASDHALARLHGDVGRVAGDSPVTVVLTGDYGKVAQKYAAFALRIVLLDSGCAQATARAAAAALGVPLGFRPEWDDAALGAALLVDPDAEPVTAVLDLGGVA